MLSNVFLAKKIHDPKNPSVWRASPFARFAIIWEIPGYKALAYLFLQDSIKTGTYEHTNI
jgi:hypothetical protein